MDIINLVRMLFIEKSIKILNIFKGHFSFIVKF